MPGEPSHPARDHISLDSVFGDDQTRRVEPERGPTDALPSGAPGGPEGQGGGFSFDQFFAGAKGGGQAASAAPADAGSADAEGPRTPGRSSGRSLRPPEEEADADQFQQWLKKLKS